MSLFAALTVAVGGLNAQSDALGNVSDNISNAQTVGFKNINTNFESLVTQSNLQLNDPGGVRAIPSYQNSLQGNLIQSQNPTSLAISGNGFFLVSQSIVNADGTTGFASGTFFTRQGDFSEDKNGFLVNSSGYALNGYTVDPVTGVVDASTVAPIKISAELTKPQATSTVTYAANLPASAALGTAESESTIKVFDSLGNSHTLHLQWTKDATTINKWELNITPDDGKATADFTDSGGATVTSGSSIGTQTLDFTFNTDGTVASIADDGSGDLFTVPGTQTTGKDATASFDVGYAGASNQTLTLNFGQFGEATGVTQYAASNLTVSNLEQNGIPQGAFQNLSIDKSGFIKLNYDNGASRTLFQIPLAGFNSPDSLQRVSGGAFEETEQSGGAQRQSPGSNGLGTIVSNTLEGSTVDIADEFTKMIQAQQVYSANAKTITTTDDMLQTAINIIR